MTKESIVDFRRNEQQNHFPLFIHGEAVERMCNIKYLGVNISEDLSGSINIASAVGKAQQHLYYLKKSRSAQITKQLMVNFYNRAISRVLTERFSSCTKADQQTLQRVVKTAGRITGAISAIYATHCLSSGWSEDHTFSAPPSVSPVPPAALRLKVQFYMSPNHQTGPQPVSPGS